VLISAISAPAAPYDAPEETAFYPTADHIQRALEHLARD
jgi:2-oxoisovalerate dehydrogenase E1 component